LLFNIYSNILTVCVMFTFCWQCGSQTVPSCQ